MDEFNIAMNEVVSSAHARFFKALNERVFFLPPGHIFGQLLND